jgi:hypothetical protein
MRPILELLADQVPVTTSALLPDKKREHESRSSPSFGQVKRPFMDISTLLPPPSLGYSKGEFLDPMEDGSGPEDALSGIHRAGRDSPKYPFRYG